MRDTIEAHYDRACKLAENQLVSMARGIMTDNPDLTEFVIGMGTWSFTRGNDYADHTNDRRLQDIGDFMDEWDRYLYLTGNPMRFTARGDIIRDW